MTRLAAMLALVTAAGGCASSAHMRRAQEDGERLRVDLAQTYIDKGAYDAAVPLLQRALAERPKDAHVHTLYGVVLRERGLYPQAERELRAATRLAPKHAPAWAALGILLDLMQRPAEAERAHRHALSLAPGQASYWNNLGFSLYVAGDDARAIGALERALALDPSLLVAYNNLGFAYGRHGDFTAAERSFRTVAGEGPALVNLALVREERGELDAAAALRARAIAIDPDLVEVTE